MSLISDMNYLLYDVTYWSKKSRMLHYTRFVLPLKYHKRSCNALWVMRLLAQ